MTDVDQTLCLMCQRRPADDPYGIGERCDPECRARLGVLLGELADWWPILADPDTLVPGQDGAGRRSPGFRSTPPLRLAVAALMAPRRAPNMPETPSDLTHPPSVIVGLADQVWAERGEVGPPGPDWWCARYLALHASWIARQSWVGEAWPTLRRVHEQVAQVMPDPPGRVLVGRCPNLVDTGGQHPEKCGTRLYLPSTGSTIPCGGCGRRYERSEWRQLGEDMQEAG